MATLLYTVGGAMVNAAEFDGGNLAFSMLREHGAGEECKRHDLVLEELQRARGKWNDDRTKRLDFINKRLRQTQAAKTYINNVDGAMFEY